jgi:hypothetical protein
LVEHVALLFAAIQEVLHVSLKGLRIERSARTRRLVDDVAPHRAACEHRTDEEHKGKLPHRRPPRTLHGGGKVYAQD